MTTTDHWRLNLCTATIIAALTPNQSTAWLALGAMVVAAAGVLLTKSKE